MNIQKIIYNLLCLTGIVLIFLGSLSSWFSVPDHNFMSSITSVELIYRIVSFIFSLFLLKLILKHKFNYLNYLSCHLCYFGLIIFLFPFFLQYFSDDIISNAAWLNSQHQNLSWLGGDIYTSQEYASSNFKNDILVIDTPRDIAVFPFPYWNLETFSLGTLSQVVNWLGYSKHFCQFVNKGFFLSLTGCFLLQLLSIIKNSEIDFKKAALTLNTNFKIALLAVSSISALVILSGAFITISENHARRGNYQKSKEALLLSSKILPIISKNSSFVYQIGLFDNKLNINSEYRKLYIAKKEIESSGTLKASLELEKLLNKKSGASSEGSREARRLITRVAIDKLNSGLVNQADNLINKVIKSEPTSLKANYIAQLVSLRKENLNGLNQLLKEQRATYRFFNSRGKKTVLASGQENEAYLNYIKNNLELSDKAWRNRGKGK